MVSQQSCSWPPLLHWAPLGDIPVWCNLLHCNKPPLHQTRLLRKHMPRPPGPCLDLRYCL